MGLRKKQDASYDKPAVNPPQDLESRLGSVLKEVQDLDTAKEKSADWYFISIMLGIAFKYVKARTKS